MVLHDLLSEEEIARIDEGLEYTPINALVELEEVALLNDYPGYSGHSAPVQLTAAPFHGILSIWKIVCNGFHFLMKELLLDPLRDY